MSVFFKSTSIHGQPLAGFDPTLKLIKIDKNAAIRCFAPDTALKPGAVFDLVTDGVLAVAGQFGEALDQYPAVGVAHGALQDRVIFRSSLTNEKNFLLDHKVRELAVAWIGVAWLSFGGGKKLRAMVDMCSEATHDKTWFLGFSALESKVFGGNYGICCRRGVHR